MTGESPVPAGPPLQWVPAALVALRLVLGPVVLLVAAIDPMPAVLGTCLVLALLSDVFDGVVARRLGTVTEALRRADSLVDTAFYACTAVAIWLAVPGLLRPHLPALGLLFVVEVARYVVDLRKFGREAAYHMWSAKAWGVLLFAAAFAALVVQEGGWLLGLAIWWGIVSDLEGLAISRVLPRWQADVPSLWHARRSSRAQPDGGTIGGS